MLNVIDDFLFLVLSSDYQSHLILLCKFYHSFASTVEQTRIYLPRPPVDA